MLPEDVAQNTGKASQHINHTHPLEAITSSSDKLHVPVSHSPQYCFSA
jgi:hypothetical protein